MLLMWILVSSPAFAPVYDRRFFLVEKRLERPSNRTMARTSSSVQ
jgi:hypothetical protein